MKYFIDQSGKIEQTNKPTILAFSNSHQGSILLAAKDKRTLQAIYQKAGKPRSFIIQIFSALLYLLIEKNCLDKNVLLIDKEYLGHESLIKSYLVQLSCKLKKVNLLPENIRFILVGKNSQAHKVAYQSYKKNRANNKVTKEDVLALVILYER